MLSIITIGVLACIASGGTWAYFQDTITSTDNGVTTGKVSMLFDNIQVGPSGVATVTGVTIPPISPRPLMSATTPIQAHTITNTGTSSASVYVAIKSISVVSPFSTTNFIFNVAGSGIGINKAPKLFAINLGPGQTIDASISCTYQDSNKNQNAEEGKSLVYDVTYIMVPDFKPVHYP